MATLRGLVQCLLLLVVVALSGNAASAERGRPVAFDDLEGVANSESFVGPALDLAPDGASVAAEIRRRIRLFDAATGRELDDLGEGILPRWSPDGEKLAFYSLRTGKLQLWVWEKRTKASWPLSAFPGGVDPDPETRIMGYATGAFLFDWSPDGTRVAFASRVGVAENASAGHAPAVLDGTTPHDRTLAGVFAQPAHSMGGVTELPDGRKWQYRAAVPGERLVSRLFIADVATRETSEVSAVAGHAFHPAWSPDGRQIAFGLIAEDRSLQTAETGAVGLLEVGTGAVRVHADGEGIRHRPRWSVDGTELAYLVSAQWTSQPELRIGRADGADRARAHEIGRRLHSYDWDRRSGDLLLAYSDEGLKLGRLDRETGAVAPLSARVGLYWAQAQTGDVAWIEERDTDLRVQVLRADASQATTLVQVDTTPGEPLRLGRVETIRYRTARGFVLEGNVLYPPDHVAGKRYPLIVDVYPMSSGQRWMHPMSGNQAWAAAGYVVFKPVRIRAPHVAANCSGDEAYCRASRGPEAWDVMVDDVLSGVDALIRRDLVDPDRMCLYGHSNGGGVVNYLVTRTDRFRCAVSVAPVWSNWLGSPLLTGWWAGMADMAGVGPLEDPDAYVELSAVLHADKVSTPMLLAVGDRDGVFLLSAIEMYQALRFAGKEVTLLRYPGQDHIFSGDGLRDLWTRQMAFFDRYLQPARSQEGADATASQDRDSPRLEAIAVPGGRPPIVREPDR